MSVKDRDPLTGYETTGHEWNGITELNTRVPRAIWWAIGITHVWALIYWVLMPAWPLMTTYTKGLLGYSDQARVENQLAAAAADRADWTGALASLPVGDIRQDPVLMARVSATAPALFGDNCAACHGSDGRGGPGFPDLADAAWLWGGDAQAILETLRVGINAPHPETRFAQMPAFGDTGMLTRPQIRAVAAYVGSLSGAGDAAAPDAVAQGEALFTENCTGCHGDKGQGSRDIGAPDLTDAAWIYGGDPETLFATILHGRQGWMPAWEGRLSLADRKILTLYIQNLGKEDAE